MYTNNDCEISGISVCVPKKQIDNKSILKFKDKNEFIQHTGVNRHFLDLNQKISPSDLCLVATNKIIKHLKVYSGNLHPHNSQNPEKIEI